MNREEIIEAMAAAVAGHDYNVSVPDWAIGCLGCDWVEDAGVPEAHDAHRAELALNAVDHLIRADALMDAAYELDAELGEPTEPMSLREAVDIMFQNHTRDIVKWLCDRAEELRTGQWT